jgi:hypothetical protein
VKNWSPERRALKLAEMRAAQGVAGVAPKTDEAPLSVGDKGKSAKQCNAPLPEPEITTELRAELMAFHRATASTFRSWCKRGVLAKRIAEMRAAQVPSLMAAE